MKKTADKSNADDDEASRHLYPIRTVSDLTGVHAITLRAWERRYGLIQPKRTPKGHRLYSEDDIHRIHQILELLDKGVSIGQVSDALISGPAAGTGETDLWVRQRERMIAAVARFDETTLEQLYNEALSLYPVDMVTRYLLTPMLRDLGERWQQLEGGIAEEHFFGMYLRNKLGARLHHRSNGNDGPRLLLACLPGEHHEIGLLLFALGAHDRGYRLVLLGADTPLEEIPVAARRSKSDAVILSGSVELAPEMLEQGLPLMVKSNKLPVFVGGQTSVNYRDLIARAGAIPTGTDIPQGLRKIDEVLGNHG